jgi:hypothetical protein
MLVPSGFYGRKPEASYKSDHVRKALAIEAVMAYYKEHNR